MGFLECMGSAGLMLRGHGAWLHRGILTTVPAVAFAAMMWLNTRELRQSYEVL
jgi:hypothetical protein